MNCFDCDHFGTLEEKEGKYCADKKEIIEDFSGCSNLMQSEASKYLHEIIEEEKDKPKIRSLLRY